MDQYDDRLKHRRGRGNRKGGQLGPADSAKDLYLADRAGWVSERILAGKTFRQIAAELGISVAQAHGDYERALLSKKAANVDELRDRYNARYEAVIAGHIDAAVAGDARSADIVIKATSAAARLNGAEAPQKHEVTGENGGPIVVEGAHDDLLGRLARIASAGRTGASDPKPEPN